MPSIEVKHNFRGSLQQVFSAISSYPKYPEYLQGISGVKVLDPIEKDSSALVSYEINIIKKFYYTLNMFDNGSNEVTWTLHESNLMKHNNGHWKLKELGPKSVEATYGLDIKFRGLVPSKITDQVAKINIPIMFEGFQNLIDDMNRK